MEKICKENCPQLRPVWRPKTENKLVKIKKNVEKLPTLPYGIVGIVDIVPVWHSRHSYKLGLLQCNNKFDTNHEVEYVVVVFTSQ